MMSRRLASSSSMTGSSDLSHISDNSDDNQPVSLRSRPASQYNQHGHRQNSVPTLGRVPTLTSARPRTLHGRTYTDDESEDQDTHQQRKHDSELTYVNTNYLHFVYFIQLNGMVSQCLSGDDVTANEKRKLYKRGIETACRPSVCKLYLLMNA